MGDIRSTTVEEGGAGRGPTWPALLTGLVLLALVVAGTLLARHLTEREARAHVDREADAAVIAVQRRLAATSEVLHAVRSFFRVEGDAPHERFGAFVQGLQAPVRHRGLRTVSFAAAVGAEAWPAYARHLTAHGSPSVPAAPARVLGPGSPYFVIHHVEPRRGNGSVLGYDLAAEPRRRTALRAAIATGRPVATPPLRLVQDGRLGFLVLQATRDQHGRLLGVASAAFDAQQLLSGVVPEDAECLEIRDAGAATGEATGGELLVVAGAGPESGAKPSQAYAARRTLEVAGRRWELRYRPRADGAVAAAAWIPWLVGVGGGIAALLASGLVHLLTRSRALAIRLAHRMTADVVRSHAELERSHRQLELARERFRSLVDSAPDAMVIVDGDGRIVLVNEQTLSLFGYDRAELEGETVELLVPDHGREAHAPTTEAVPLLARRKDGSQVPVEVRLSPIETDQGQWFTSTIRDVSERRRAEDALRLAEQQQRAAFDRAPIGMALLDLDGRHLRVNEALCALTGRTPDVLRRLRLEQLVHEADRAAVHGGLVDLMAGRIEVQSTELRLLHAEGRAVWASLHGTLVRGADGAPSHLLVQVLDVTERRRFEGRLQHMADHDPLTGLLNRRAFDRELQRHVAAVGRYGAQGALLVLDLDHFKYVNDTLGHGAGDALILSVADVLRTRLRTTDVLARLGGDEFAVLLPHGDAQDAAALAQSLVDAIGCAAAGGVLGLVRPVTASVGVATFQGAGVSGEQVLIDADLAMYEAKEAGRNRVAVFTGDEQDGPSIRSRMGWIERLERALAGDGLVLHAQPIVDLRTGAIARHEVLVRLRGDDGRLVLPAHFLPIAERYGLVGRIDRHVVLAAIDAMAAAARAGQDLHLAVNLSAKSLADEELPEAIERRLVESGVPAHHLTLEITETAAVGSISLARAFAQRLRGIGCRLALDDFGAGFGTLYYLKHLPFDEVKIDGDFVANCVHSETDRLLIETVVSLARGMGACTVGEFTRDEDTVQALRERGVDFAQGFHLGVPRALDELLGGTQDEFAGARLLGDAA